MTTEETTTSEVTMQDVIAWSERDVQPGRATAWQLGKCQAALFLALGSETARERLRKEIKGV